MIAYLLINFTLEFIDLFQCSSQEKLRLEECEKKLDLTSIVIMRQKIELEMEKLELQKTESKGWFSSWWGGNKKQQQQGNLKELGKSPTLCKHFVISNFNFNFYAILICTYEFIKF